MVFQDLDRWMLDIEDKRNPSAKERRLHLKLEKVRDETWNRYKTQFDKNHYYNTLPTPKCCMERAMFPHHRTFKKGS